MRERLKNCENRNAEQKLRKLEIMLEIIWKL